MQKNKFIYGKLFEVKRNLLYENQDIQMNNLAYDCKNYVH